MDQLSGQIKTAKKPYMILLYHHMHSAIDRFIGFNEIHYFGIIKINWDSEPATLRSSRTLLLPIK